MVLQHVGVGAPCLPSHPGEGEAQNDTVLGGTNSSMAGGRSKLLPGEEGRKERLHHWDAQEVPGPMPLWDEAALAVWLYTHKGWRAHQMVSAITPWLAEVP